MPKDVMEIISKPQFTIELKIYEIMFNTIKLKSENRDIGQRIRNLHQNRNECIKTIKLNMGNHSLHKGFNKKIDSNINLHILLSKLQDNNSKLILKHRAKIKELQKELNKLNKEENNT